MTRKWLILISNITPFQTIQYITKNKVMETESRELAAVSRGKIRAGETDDWKSEQLFVPPLPPTNLRGWQMIRIQYDVFVSITKYHHRPWHMISWWRCWATIFIVSIYTAEFQFFGNDDVLFQFIVTPSNFEKPLKLQLPILLATYPLRNEDGTMRRKTKAEYPTTLPIFRPWLDEKNLWQSTPDENNEQISC